MATQLSSLDGEGARWADGVNTKVEIMAIIKVQKGTKDILPNDMTIWHFMEEKALEVFSKYGAQEIRTPIFEATELFARGVGDTTDIVNKEMYTFEKSERSLTLRPENTAGVVRSFIENGMHRLSAPVKLWYKALCLDMKGLKQVVKDNFTK